MNKMGFEPSTGQGRQVHRHPLVVYGLGEGPRGSLVQPPTSRVRPTVVDADIGSPSRRARQTSVQQDTAPSGAIIYKTYATSRTAQVMTREHITTSGLLSARYWQRHQIIRRYHDVLHVPVDSELMDMICPKFSGAHVGENQKLQFLNELLDAVLEQSVSFRPLQSGYRKLNKEHTVCPSSCLGSVFMQTTSINSSRSSAMCLQCGRALLHNNRSPPGR
jgi:hypothetical protein